MMAEEFRPASALEYESRLSPARPAPPPVAVCVAAMACGTVLVLAPWLAVGLNSSSVAASMRYVSGSPLTWLTVLPGLGLIGLGYFRARR